MTTHSTKTDSTIKQVDKSKYNKEYFVSLFKTPDYSKKVTLNSFGHIYREIANLYKLSPEDRVVDFGCGNGELSFCLHKRYNPTIFGIDYSKDAIEVSNVNLNLLKKRDKNLKIKFINTNNNHLPDLKDINYVYFCDVLEHMYDHEIATVLNEIKKWNKTKIKILIHTDNNIFLRFVRPFLDLLAIISGLSNPKAINKRNIWESERHVNLTNPRKLREFIELLGFRQVKLVYSVASEDKVGRQLGDLSSLAFLKSLSFTILHFFKSLSPSFYAVYVYESKK